MHFLLRLLAMPEAWSPWLLREHLLVDWWGAGIGLQPQAGAVDQV
jgi:hypothetical protein